MTEEKKLVHEVCINMLWGDMDALAHLNNVQYYRYCEQVRAEWLRHIEFPFTPNPHMSLVIVHSSCTYLRPIHYPAEVIVKMYHRATGRSSISHDYEFFVAGDPDTVYAEASSKLVCIDPSHKRSIPIPEFIAKHLP